MRSESMAEPKPAEPNIRALGDRDRHRRSLLSRSARRSIIHGDAAPGPHIGGVGRRSDNWETSAPDLTLEGRAGRYRAAARRSSAQRLKPLLQRATARLARRWPSRRHQAQRTRDAPPSQDERRTVRTKARAAGHTMQRPSSGRSHPHRPSRVAGRHPILPRGRRPRADRGVQPEAWSRASSGRAADSSKSRRLLRPIVSALVVLV